MTTLPTQTARAPHPALQEIDESSLGPAMLALTPQRRAFVQAKVFFGVDNKKAAEMAGYSPVSPHSLESQGYKLAHDPLVQEALREESVKMMRSEGVRSLHTLVNLRDDTSIAPRERLRAAIEIMNRCGLHAVTESHVSVEHRMSDAEKDRRILALCAEMGLSEAEAKKMLISPLEAKKVADAEFEVIEPERPMTDEERATVAERDERNTIRRARYRMTPNEREAHRKAANEERRQRGKRQYAEAKQAEPLPLLAAIEAANVVEAEEYSSAGLEDLLLVPEPIDTTKEQ